MGIRQLVAPWQKHGKQPPPAGPGEVFAMTHSELGTIWGRVIYERGLAFGGELDNAYVEIFGLVSESGEADLSNVVASPPVKPGVWVEHRLWTLGYARLVGSVPFVEGEWAPRGRFGVTSRSYGRDQFGVKHEDPPGPGESLRSSGNTEYFNLLAWIEETAREYRDSFVWVG